MALIVSSMYIAGGAVHSKNADKFVPNTTSNEVGYSATTDERIMSSKDVEKYVRDQYSSDPILVDIARCESTFRQFDTTGHVIRGKVNSADVGVMQINEKYHSDKAVELGLNIYTIEGNLAYAKYLYERDGAQPWISSSKCWAKPIILAKI